MSLLTLRHVGLGARFRAQMGNAGMEMLLKFIEFDRPRRLGPVHRTTSSMMETVGTITNTSEAGGTRLSWNWQVQPQGRVQNTARW